MKEDAARRRDVEATEDFGVKKREGDHFFELLNMRIETADFFEGHGRRG